MTAERFRPEHVAEITGSEAGYARACYLAEHSEAAFTVRVGGKAMIASGIVDSGSGLAYLWSFVSPQAHEHPVVVHRSALRFLSMFRFRRIEATCKSGFAQGAEWLVRLGFQFEGRMVKWASDGSDHDLYALVTR